MKMKIKVAVLIDAWFPFTGGGQIHVSKLKSKLESSCRYKIYHANSSKFMSRVLWTIWVIPKFLRDNKRERFDMIHAHSYIAGIPGKVLSQITGIPVIYTIHGSHTLDLKKLAGKQTGLINKPPAWKYLLEKWLLTKIQYDYQISVSNNFLKYNNENKKIAIIANGADIKEFDEVSIKKRKQFTIIYVGKEGQIKGLSYLLSAFHIVKKSYPDIKLIKVLGKIRDRKKLIKMYKSSHLFVLPSLAEGQPISLLEAWAARLPVIVTSVGDNSNMVSNKVTGYLVPPADVKALSNTILNAIQNPNLEELGNAGYNLVKKRYSWDIAANKLLKVYKEVLNDSR
jgi:glycosyltransferase involved in cell wall biosynthesis